MITIVTGQARTGTSLTMMILDRGGITAEHDPEINKAINPFGSFETRKEIVNPAEFDGKSIKCLTPQVLFDLPQADYKVVMPIRDPEQIILSRLEVFKGKQFPKNLDMQKKMIEKQYRFIKFIVEARKDMELLEVIYDDYFQKTDEAVAAIESFVGVQFNKEEAKKAVALEQYKVRDLNEIKQKFEDGK